MGEAYTARKASRQVTPDLEARFQQGLRTLNNSTAPRSQAEYEEAARTWLESAGGARPDLVQPPVNEPPPVSRNSTGGHLQDRQIVDPPQPELSQKQAERHWTHNHDKVQEAINGFKDNIGNFSAEEIKMISADFKQELDRVSRHDDISDHDHRQAYDELNKIEKLYPLPAADPRTKGALPGSSFGSSSEELIEHDEIVKEVDKENESIKGGISREDTLIEDASTSPVDRNKHRSADLGETSEERQNEAESKTKVTKLPERSREDERTKVASLA
jgi:hypothetical protein